MPKGRAPQRGLEPRDCVVCSTRFQPYRDFHVTCGSRPCRAKAAALNPRRVPVTLICKYCEIEFEAEWSGIGRRPPCPDCAVRLAKENQARKNVARRIETAKDPEARRLINLRNTLSRYGVTPDEYQLMLAAQDSKCSLCGFVPPPGGVKAASRLHVDHDHETGRVRSLLCNGCNRGLGYLQDSPELLRAAADYIERHRAPQSP